MIINAMLIDKVDHLILLQIVQWEDVGQQEHTEGSSKSLVSGVIICFLSADRWTTSKNEIGEIKEWKNISGQVASLFVCFVLSIIVRFYTLIRTKKNRKMKKIDKHLDRVLRTGSMVAKEGKSLSISKYF